MTRRRRTTLQRAALFEAHGGLCHICGQRIDGTREAWEVEHIVPYHLTRDDTDANLAPAHVACHAAKTKLDKATIAKSDRVRAKHMGARGASTFPGSKASKYKRKINGEVVARKG